MVLELPEALDIALETLSKQESQKAGRKISKRAVALRLLAQALADELGDSSLVTEAPKWGGRRDPVESDE